MAVAAMAGPITGESPRNNTPEGSAVQSGTPQSDASPITSDVISRAMAAAQAGGSEAALQVIAQASEGQSATAEGAVPGQEDERSYHEKKVDDANARLVAAAQARQQEQPKTEAAPAQTTTTPETDDKDTLAKFQEALQEIPAGVKTETKKITINGVVKEFLVPKAVSGWEYIVAKVNLVKDPVRNLVAKLLTRGRAAAVVAEIQEKISSAEWWKKFKDVIKKLEYVGKNPVNVPA